MADKTRRSVPRQAGRAGRSGHAAPRTRRQREGGEQLRLAQAALGMVTWIWDIETGRTRWYGDASALLGLPAGGFSGHFRDYLKHVHPDDAQRARAIYVECLKGLRPEYHAQERVLWPDGSVHWLENYGRAEYGGDGRALRMMGVVADITERKRQESARKKAEALLSQVFESSPDYISIARAEDGRFVAVNPAFERMIGYGEAEIVGRTSVELGIWAIPGERGRFVADLHRDGMIRNRPVLFRARSGQVISGTLTSSLISHDGESLVVSVVRDVTEARRLERRASESQRKFAAFFDASRDAMIISRARDAVHLEVNAAWVRQTGYAREQVLGRSAHEIELWVEPEQRRAIIARIEAERVVDNQRVRFRRADGRPIDALLSGAAIDLDGEACIVWTWTDVTEVLAAQEKALQAERKFAALFEHSPEPISLFRLSDQRRLAANSAWERVTGHSRELAAARPATALSLFRSRDERDAVMARVVAEGSVSNIEQRLVRADGAEFDALLSGVCLEVDGERCVLWNWRDISEQRSAERARSQSDARYRALFETAFDGMLIVTPDKTVLEANPAICAMSGYAPGELVGASVARLFVADDLAARPLRGGEGGWSIIERPLARKDGAIVTVEVMVGLLPDGNSLGILRDITERKRSENLLMNVAHGVSAALGEEFFRSLVEHLARELGADVAFIGALVEPERARVRTLACVRDGAIAANFEYELAGSPCDSALSGPGTVVHAEGVAERFPRDAGLRQHGIEAYVGTALHGADGAPLGMLVVMSRKPISRGQFWASMIEIFGTRAAAEIERARAEARVREANESLEAVVRERTAQLEEANLDLDGFNYSISHDLRQPLNAIAGFADLLRERLERAGDETMRDSAREIEANAARMEQMIDSLMRLSRAGRGALRKSDVDMRRLAEEVLRELAPQGGAEVVLGELPPAQGDAVLLRQVWSNLIANAIKYSRRSRLPRIEIRGRREGGGVAYEVRDNGIGFDMREAARLFGTFERLPSAAGFEGSGVGLAIVQRILRRHGGAISARSAPGEGAVFSFTLP